MKVAITVIAILIGLLSIAAGGAKIALVPDEVHFLGQFGATSTHIITFGVAQVLGGALLLLPGTRTYGSIIAGIAFGLSAFLLWLSGDRVFAGVSFVPVFLAGLVAFHGYLSREALDGSKQDV